MQVVVAAFEAEGLDPWQYAPICADPLTEAIERTRIVKRRKVEIVESTTNASSSKTASLSCAVTTPVERVIIHHVAGVDAKGRAVLDERAGEPVLYPVPC